MILDTEDQRALLLRVIQSAPFEGSYEGAKKLVNVLSRLEQAVLAAEVAAPSPEQTEEQRKEGLSDNG